MALTFLSSSSFLGKYYIKMGHWDELLKGFLTSAKEVQEWFLGNGDQDLGKQLEQAIINVVKGKTM